MQVDWLNINPLTGGTGQTEIYAYVTANEKIGSTRTAVVRFTNEEGLTADLNLEQPSDTSDMRFVVTPDYIYVPGGGGVYYVNVLSNTYWKVTDYDSGLTITTDNYEGYGDGILRIEFPVNPNTNNQYGYDHYGWPFYGREGYITVTSLMGPKRVFWEQAAYGAITVTPGKLIFSETGGTQSVVVKSSVDWTITSYDSAHTSFSALSGTSGETTIYVTKSALTQSQIDYYVTCPSEAIFSDGINNAVLELDSMIDSIYNDDDWITVYYDIPSANTETILYSYNYDLAIQPTVRFEDEDHTEIGGIGVPIVGDTILQFYTTFTTPGIHIVKYKFNKDGCILPKHSFIPSSVVGSRGESHFKKLVIGNKCEGYIAGCAAMDAGFEEVVLGLVNITNIGEAAFLGCGSYDKDFILGPNVDSTYLQPFHNFKARKFIYNQELLGSTGAPSEQTVEHFADGGTIISGASYSYKHIYATTEIYNTDSYIGDIKCRELVIGQNVKNVGGHPFYPFGFSYIYSNSTNVFDYIRATSTFRYDNPITGWEMNSITFLSKTEVPSQNYDISPVTQEFKESNSYLYPVFRTAVIGPARTTPMHCPIGSNYSTWSAYGWNITYDIDI